MSDHILKLEYKTMPTIVIYVYITFWHYQPKAVLKKTEIPVNLILQYSDRELL